MQICVLISQPHFMAASDLMFVPPEGGAVRGGIGAPRWPAHIFPSVNKGYLLRCRSALIQRGTIDKYPFANDGGSIMNMFQTKQSNGTYRLMITSDKPILVTYYELLELARGIEFEADPGEVTFWLRDADCPPPINHDQGIDAPLAEGIWVYDRVLAHFDVMMGLSGTAKASKLAGSVAQDN